MTAWKLTYNKEGINSMAARKRELVEPHPGAKRYIRRDDEGRFTSDQVDVGRSLRQDVKHPAKRIVPSGRGDNGDQRRRGR